MTSVIETQVINHRFGDIARSLGLVTLAQLDESLVMQNSLRNTGARLRIGEILIMKNVLTVEQVKKILSEQRKRKQAESDKAMPVEYFGEYKLLEKLGEGGMGAVYKAQETMADRLVALKVLRKEMAGNPGFVERFTREARLAGSLNHPNLVLCHTSGTVRGVQFLVMEYIEGETLKARLNREGGKLPEKETLRIIRDVALGIGHAHEKGIIHRDIKPENILLSKDGSVKLSDFGTAKAYLAEDTLSRTGVVIGTPHYISPEQVRAAKNIDYRADLYALGGTMYHALTGKVPFDAKTSLEIMKKHLHEELDNPRDINPLISVAAVEIVSKLMAKMPTERYQNADDVVEDIERVLAGQNTLNATLEQNKSSIKQSAKAKTPGCLGILATAGFLSFLYN